MRFATLRQVGGSVMVAIPRPLLDALSLAPNARVGLAVEQGRLVLEPQAKPRYALAELLAQCDLEAPATDEESRAWLEDRPQGREAI